MISNNLETGNPAVLVLRTDMSSAIGAGHMMRCVALAQCWKKQGGSVVFISHCQSRHIIGRIESEGFTFIPVNQTYPNPGDLSKTEGFLTKCKAEKPSANHWLAIDGYHFDASYHKEVRNTGFKLLVIDDYHHLPEYNFDILLNQNFGAENLDYDYSTRKEYLLGSKYVLLRQEFLNHGVTKDAERDCRESAKNVLITLGGADIDNVSLEIAQILNSYKLSKLRIKIVVGPANPNLAVLKTELNGSLHRYEIIVSPDDMPGLMHWADVAVSAAGSTCWELAYMGVPSAVVVLTDNQEIIADGLEKSRAAVNLGRFEALTIAKFRDGFFPIIESKALQIELIRNQRKLVDGRGAERVIKRMK